ncbi:hypothetical protein ACQVP2_17380 [Methylobacterium aquaticum]|uniref:hypothetical protein n=1 Tax=Methylobacterium aquaticum TaxID=270351 RepID=UPI003D16CF2F
MTATAGFTEALAQFGSGIPVVLCHDDADGLSAGALFARALAQTAHGRARVRVIGRGESAWSDTIRAELATGPPVAGLVVADLGVQAEPILPGVPTILVDHHVPRSLPAPEVATVISGLDEDPVPTSSLLAHRCAAALLGEAGAEALFWLAAPGAVGNLGERGAVPGCHGWSTAARHPNGSARRREPGECSAPLQPRPRRACLAPAAAGRRSGRCRLRCVARRRGSPTRSIAPNPTSCAPIAAQPCRGRRWWSTIPIPA